MVAMVTSSNTPNTMAQESGDGVLTIAEAPVQDGRFRCPVCGEVLGSAHALTVHIRQHNDQSHTCRVCGKTLSSASSLDRHMLVHSGERPFRCSVCHMAFTTNGNMHRHMRTHTLSEDSKIRPALKRKIVPECPSKGPPKSIDVILLAASESQENKIPSDKVEAVPMLKGSVEGEPTSVKTLKLFNDVQSEVECPICKIVLPCKKTFSLHLLTHASVEKLIGPQEGKKENFLALLDLKNSKSPRPSNGSSELPHDFADIQSIISLTSQAPLVPSSSPSVACPASPPQVTTCLLPPESPLIADSAHNSPQLPVKEDPESNRQDPESTLFSCQLCKLSFKTLSAAKRHNRSNHMQGGSFYACNVCSYSSLDKSTLNRHLRTHNGERPFQCSICGYAFTTKANCERHIRKRHKKITRLEIKNSMQYNTNLTLVKCAESLASCNDTICKYCNVDFKNHRLLRHHLRSLNNSCTQKPFFCTLCQQGFSTKNNCIRHVQNLHPDMKESLSKVVLKLALNGQALDNSVSSDDVQLSTPPAELSQDSEPLNLCVDSSASSDQDDRRVTAAKSLVILSELPPPQEEPLNLTVHALDLSVKSSPVSEDEEESGKMGLAELASCMNRPFICTHCSACFTLKSNMERHVKKKHPDFSKPIVRNRNFLSELSTPEPKANAASTLSNKTRTALRIILNNKSGHLGAEDLGKGDGYEGGADLASISSLLDTANCSSFSQYLIEEEEDNSVNKNEIQPESLHKNNSENEERETENSLVIIKKKSKKSSYSGSQNVVSCPVCALTFPWKSSLNRHILTHTGEKPFKCLLCPIRFTTKSNRDRHMWRKHCFRRDKTKSWRCKLCPGMIFTTPGNFKRHHYIKHLVKLASKKTARPILKDPKEVEATGEEDAQPQARRMGEDLCCELCKVSYLRKEDFLAHLADQHPAQVRTCSLNCSSPETLKEHMKSHSESSEEKSSEDLIQKLLGIQDSKIIDQMLDSADSAARLLGVAK